MGNKFKVGDRIRRIVDDGDGAPKNFKSGFETTAKMVTENSVIDAEGFYHSICNVELIQPATSAIRTVTRREIVPGEYGIVTVFPDGAVYVSGVDVPSAAELREAAHLFNQIAEVLEENAAQVVKEAA